MKLKRLFSTIILVAVVFSACCLCFSACNTPEPQPTWELKPQVIDDNYRNYYEIFVRSFYDSDDDGYGDLNGVTAKLDYVKEMGFNGIWLMPVHPSPSYHKYDVADYREIDKQYGTLADMENLLAEAHKRGIKVIMDLVVNHTSPSHQWFKNFTSALQSNQLDSKYAKYYNYSTTKQSGYWQLNGTNYYYEGRFTSTMPDLNLDNPDVRAEIRDVMEYWLDKGADGFRLDACTSYYTGNVDKNVEFLSWLNTEAKKIKSDCYIVGEVWEGTDVQIRRYYDSGIDSCFLFTGSTAGNKLSRLFSILNDKAGKEYADWLVSLQSTYDTGILAPFLCNHDTARISNAMGKSRSEKIKMAAGLLSLMNGSTFVYYGDEIGMVTASNPSDPDKRIAMLWGDDIYTDKGYCYKPVEGAQKVNENSYVHPSVVSQQQDENSILNYYKAAMHMRNCFPEIARGTVAALDCENLYVALFTKTYRDSTITVVVNMNPDETETIPLGEWGSLLYSLCALEGSVEIDGTTLNIPAFGIAIFGDQNRPDFLGK